jgi:hypothetical protein
MAKKFSEAKFHQSLHCKGLGELGSKLPSDNKAASVLEMTETDTGLDIRMTLAVTGKTGRLLVPWANVVYAAVIDEQAPVKPESKSTK